MSPLWLHAENSHRHRDNNRAAKAAARRRSPYRSGERHNSISEFGLKLLLFALAMVLATVTGSAAGLTLKVVDKEPPKGLNPAIAATLQKSAVQLLEGDKPVFEFWFASELSLTAKPASPDKALDVVKQATLLGAVSVSKALHDYREDTLPAKVHTMRFALQPQDGNHLGTAEFLYFAVLVPSNLDTKPDGIADYKALVKASSKETSTDHPVILSLRPASSADGEFPRLNEPAPEHKSVRVKVPAKFGEEKTTVVFDVVYEGKGHK
jgi:hypothetical protein